MDQNQAEWYEGREGMYERVRETAILSREGRRDGGRKRGREGGRGRRERGTMEERRKKAIG